MTMILIRMTFIIVADDNDGAVAVDHGDQLVCFLLLLFFCFVFFFFFFFVVVAVFVFFVFCLFSNLFIIIILQKCIF